MIYDDIQSWFIVFWNRNPLNLTWRDRLWWRDFWAVGGYRHVSCFGFSPSASTWVHVNPDPKKQNIVLAKEGPQAQAMIEGLMACGSIVKVDAGQRKFGLFGVMNCVTIVKHTIGLQCGALTPAGLRTHTLCIGSEVSNVKSSRDSSSGPI